MKQLLILILALASIVTAQGKSRGEVIAYDTDTLAYQSLGAFHKSFDFLLTRASYDWEDMESDSFVIHIMLGIQNDSLYGINRSYGPLGFDSRMSTHGKCNFDSIVLAKPDSMKNDIGGSYDRFFQVPFSEISSLKGNCYSMRTTKDPREQSYYFVKIKILDVIVKDSATRSIEMPFLWLCNYTSRDLTSPFPLDTLNGQVGILSDRKKVAPATNFRSGTMRVSGSSLAVPAQFASARSVHVFNLRGQLLQTIKLNGQSVINFPSVESTKIIRFER